MLTADKTRILVTGGAGFVGANLVRMLPRQDFEVTLLDDLSEGKREYLTGLPSISQKAISWTVRRVGVIQRSAWRQPAPASEDKAPLPIAPYGASKLAAEGYCLAYHGSWQLSTVVFRFANVYGPSQHTRTASSPSSSRT